MALKLVAGPCVLEERDTVMRIAERLKAIAAEREIDFTFKASYDKANRTSGESLRGPGLDDGPWPKFGLNNRNTASIQSPLYVSSPEPVQFAFAESGAAADLALVATNATDEPITLTGFSPSNPAFSLVNPLPMPVPARGSPTLAVRFAPSGIGLYETSFETTYDYGGEPLAIGGELTAGIFQSQTFSTIVQCPIKDACDDGRITEARSEGVLISNDHHRLTGLQG